MPIAGKLRLVLVSPLIHHCILPSQLLFNEGIGYSGMTKRAFAGYQLIMLNLWIPSTHWNDQI